MLLRSATRRLVVRLLAAAIAVGLLIPATGSGNVGSGPGSAGAATTKHRKHPPKKKRKRKRVACKRYRKVRVKRGHRHRIVKRCVKAKKKPRRRAPRATPPPARSGGFLVGINSGPAPVWEATQMPSIHPRLVRFPTSISTPASALAQYVGGMAARGTEVLPLATFYGRVPTASEAQNLASWAHAFGPGGTFWRGRTDGYLAMRHIEFGNETNQSYQFSGCGPGCSSYTSRAQAYAQRARDAINAIDGPNGNSGVSLLVQGDSGGCACSQWIDGMFSAVPNLNRLVGGWTVHPYGPKARYAPILNEMVRDTAKHGDTTVPIWATEYGIASDNGRCLSDNYMWPRCLTYAQAALDLHGGIADLHNTYGSRLAAVLIFVQRDLSPSGSSSNREGYFGAFQHNGAPKGAYTAEVQFELATYRG